MMKSLILFGLASLSTNVFAGTITITSGQGSYTTSDGTLINFKAKPTTSCYCKIEQVRYRHTAYELTLKNPISTSLNNADTVLDVISTREECLKKATNDIDCQKL